MIIIRLTGGLGNQMFQYATARCYQRDELEPIYLDTRMLQALETDIEKIMQRPFALDIYSNLKAKKSSKHLHQLLTKSDLITKVRRKIFKLTAKSVIQDGMSPIDFCHTKSKVIYLQGDFQSEKDFWHLKKQLVEEFNFPALDLKNEAVKQSILNTPNAVSLHIRRGDYLSSINKDAFTSVNLNYYRKAIDRLKEKLNIKTLNTFIFTDDADWVRDNLNFDDIELNLIEGNVAEHSWKDMCLMTCCQHHVIANSSFSWWGAWLSENDGFNIAPRHWYKPFTKHYAINDIVPKAWEIIDYDL